MFLQQAACILGFALAVQSADSGCSADGKTFKAGEQYDVPGHCSLNLCKGNDEWDRAACGLIGIPHKWVLVPEDTTKGYPECCGYVVPPLDIIPDVLDKQQWFDNLDIEYDGGIKVDLGNELTPTQVKNEPKVTFTAEPSASYLLCMTDPDAPSRAEPTSREFQHWLVGNIPGNNVSAGEVISAYVGSGPPKGSGLHRYIFVLYKQPGKLTFDEPKSPNTSFEHRRLFSIRKFAKKYDLGEPIAINVYQAQYDDYVPTLHKQLGLVKKD